MASGDATESRLVVAIRPRPLAGGVPPDGSLRFDCGTANAVACSSASSGTEEVLQFDRVFAPDAMNDDVYTAVAQPVVKAALRGINGAVAAYGQTSSGKTHTMRGTADDPGIVPRAVEEVFAYVSATPEREFSLSLAYLEIYNENVRDLLNPAAKLDVYEGLQGVEVKNCKPTPVGDVAAAMRLLAEGDGRRATAETGMNAQSSRSHSIVRLLVTSKPAGSVLEGRGLVAVLSLVDLAGSETAKKTGATSGARATEGANINKSLFALSRVIEALSQKENAFLKPPFRDSKLTHLLKPALDRGASSMTALVCAIHPAGAHSAETGSTLQFARRARCVVTRPVVTEELSAKDKARRLAEENDRMRAEFAAKQAEDADAARKAEADKAACEEAQRAEMALMAERLAFVEQEAAVQAAKWAAEAQTLRHRIARGNAALASKEAALAAAVAAGGDPSSDSDGDGGASGGAAKRGGREPGRRATWAPAGGQENWSGGAGNGAAAPDADGPQALLSAASDEMARLKTVLDEERRGRRRAEAAAEALRQEVVMLQQERGAWRHAGEEAAQQCAVAQSAAASAAVDVDIARQQAAEAVSETEKWRESARKADARWLRAQHDVAAAEDRLKVARADGDKLRADCDAASARAAAAEARALKAESDALKAAEAAKELQAAVEAAEGQAAAAQAQVAAAQARAQALAAVASDSSAQQDRSTAQALAEAEKRASAAETAADLAAGEVARLRSELASARREAHAACERASAAEAETGRSRAQAAAATERVARSEAESQARLADVAAALDKEAASRRAAHDAAADAAETKAQLADLRARLAQLASQHEAHGEQLAEAQARVEVLEGEVASLRDIEAAAAEVVQQNEAETAEKARLVAQLDSVRADLAAESAARAEAEAQVEQLLEEGVGGGGDALESAQQMEALADEVVALEARALEAEARAAALAAQLAAALKAAHAQPATDAHADMPPPVADDDGQAAACGGEAPAPVAGAPPPHRLAGKDHPVAAARARAQLDAAKAACVQPSAAPSAAPAPAAAAAPGGKPKCGVCPNPSRARVGAHPHPVFTHIQVCKACFSGLDAPPDGDAKAEAPKCTVCAAAVDGNAASWHLCATPGCGGAFCATCMGRHFPEEEALDAAPHLPWPCFLCRDECPQRRGARFVLLAPSAGQQEALAQHAVNGRPCDDKENAQGGTRPGSKPGATKRKLGANRALDDDVRY